MDTRSRTLKLALLADTKNFNTGLDKATKQTQSFSSKMKANAAKIGKAFALAGVAVAGMAAKLAIDGVKAAIEDQKAQVKLATTLKNTTNASAKQTKQVEKYIDKLQRASGVADDKLRPSLSKLLIATKDVAKAQKLQGLAMDIAAGTGKDLDTVSLALAKAYGGNIGALTRLGIKLDDNIIKNKDFNAAAKELNKTFNGQSAAAADTMEGKFKRFNIAIDEAKESIGVALMPEIEKMVNYLNSPKGQKVITKFAKAFADAIKIIAQYLPGVVSGVSNLISNVAENGLAATFSDPAIIAATAAYAAGMTVGGPAGGALAALAAYAGMKGLEGEANSYNPGGLAKVNKGKNVAGLQMNNGKMQLLTDPSQRLYGGLTGNLKAGPGTTPKNLMNVQNPNVNNQFNIWVQGAADSREAARAIQRTLDKIALNGGSKAGIKGFN